MKYELSDQEVKALMELMNVACKAAGAQVAPAVVHLTNIFQPKSPKPKDDKGNDLKEDDKPRSK